MRKYIPIVTRKLCKKVWIKDILYITQRGRLVYVVTDEDEYSYYGKASELEPCLDKHFFCCLKWTFINFNKVESMHDQIIFFIGGKHFDEIGRTHYITTKQSFAAYMKKYFALQQSYGHVKMKKLPRKV